MATAVLEPPRLTAVVFKAASAATAVTAVLAATAAADYPDHCRQYHNAYYYPLYPHVCHFFKRFASCDGVRVSGASVKSILKVQPSLKRLQP